eukprot:GAFH01001286.1.p8 GENE.GAFH01001286.1~~GAFH01001286.1.p8  ORF type:complete len:76 (+),score=5.23 GAFH01001286.1:743-970(+)
MGRGAGGGGAGGGGTGRSMAGVGMDAEGRPRGGGAVWTGRPGAFRRLVIGIGGHPRLLLPLLDVGVSRAFPPSVI